MYNIIEHHNISTLVLIPIKRQIRLNLYAMYCRFIPLSHARIPCSAHRHPTVAVHNHSPHLSFKQKIIKAARSQKLALYDIVHYVQVIRITTIGTPSSSRAASQARRTDPTSSELRCPTPSYPLSASTSVPSWTSEPITSRRGFPMPAGPVTVSAGPALVQSIPTPAEFWPVYHWNCHPWWKVKVNCCCRHTNLQPLSFSSKTT